jgi:hypothetical protein
MRWFGLALLGILIAAAVSIAASRLASQQIGLASQPISAGDALAPAAEKKPLHHAKARHRRPENHTPSQTAPNAAPEPEPQPAETQPTEPAPLPAEPHAGGESDHPGGEAADD